jgi:hypothetical protein
MAICLYMDVGKFSMIILELPEDHKTLGPKCQMLLLCKFSCEYSHFQQNRYIYSLTYYEYNLLKLWQVLEILDFYVYIAGTSVKSSHWWIEVTFLNQSKL